MRKIFVILLMIGLLASCKPPETEEQYPATSPPAETDAEVEHLPLPRATPLAAWGDIPIMPEAVTGDILEEGKIYLFTTSATDVDVAAYYEDQMPPLGWTYLGLGEGVAGKVLTFRRDTQHLVITAQRIEPEGYLLVEISLGQ